MPRRSRAERKFIPKSVISASVKRKVNRLLYTASAAVERVPQCAHGVLDAARLRFETGRQKQPIAATPAAPARAHDSARATDSPPMARMGTRPASTASDSACSPWPRTPLRSRREHRAEDQVVRV